MSDTFLQDSCITLAHGNGGRMMRELINEIFVCHLGNPYLDTMLDAARLSIPMVEEEVMVTTDGFTVEPLEFPGGNIGSLAIHGTVNDLAVSGARPLYITLNAFLEEGLEIALLERIVATMGKTCRELGVYVVAGDTKVVRRGQGGGVYLATTGVGVRPTYLKLGLDAIQTGDMLVISGPVGDHGTAVLLAREQFGLSGRLYSDARSVFPFTEALARLPGLRFMRDPTRGGIATVAHDIAQAKSATVILYEAHLPVRPEVRSVCDMLGFDPYYLACEGQVVAVVAEKEAETAVEILQSKGCTEAAISGRIQTGRNRVVLETRLGGTRILEELEDDPLPRIC